MLTKEYATVSVQDVHIAAGVNKQHLVFVDHLHGCVQAIQDLRLV